MKDHYDFSKGRKNPFAEKLKKEGYTIMVHYSPKDIAEMDKDDLSYLDSDEIEALDKYYTVSNKG